MSEKAVEDPSILVPVIHLEDPGGILDSWLQTGTALLLQPFGTELAMASPLSLPILLSRLCMCAVSFSLSLTFPFM